MLLPPQIKIEQGEVAVYYDGASPPEGQGLNKPALVVLYNVHRLDRATGQPTTDPQVGGRLVHWGGGQ